MAQQGWDYTHRHLDCLCQAEAAPWRKKATQFEWKQSAAPGAVPDIPKISACRHRQAFVFDAGLCASIQTASFPESSPAFRHAGGGRAAMDRPQ
mmetsp:Transcript_6076/g.16930  ORF Transcript_6076/g.16930 Transcript_6076/m.16930 type:complete len:94 (+) Transcript_6076:1566-1847(+)